MAIDLSGQRYGNLTVVSEAGRDAYQRYKWRCKCDCGNETIVSSNNLRTGTSKSCGCLKSIPRRRQDLIGLRSGRLVATSYSHTSEGKAYWNCSCDCGNSTVKLAAKLKRAKVQSCGCMRPKTEGISCDAWSRALREIHQSCAKCGTLEGLHCHHILPFNQHQHLAKDPSNGVALCGNCHREFHALHGHRDFGPRELGAWLGLDNLSTKVLEVFVGHKAKGQAQDIRKAIHYCKLILELQYGETSEAPPDR